MPEHAKELAASVRDELRSAGLTVLGPEDRHGGAEVDTDGDGVWVCWHPGAELVDAGLAALRRGAYRPGGEQHRSLRHRGVVDEAITRAIKEILEAAGFTVREGADEYHRPMQLLVESRRDVAHWRDPIGPDLDGASGFVPGLRVRVLAGEFAGAELEVAAARHRLGSLEPLGYELRLPNGGGVIEVAAGDVVYAGDAENGG
ncbi:hypothetical protein ACTI_61500 [Actinoplanes sp. OR16]|uniref:hypothetical protein n=1 Tax=Actinoplanes sp. OR16 TaxID=946334 RepID=UPI000F6F620F|nr:hypothetical protein [Actinoplanes sp. OR16]BBH69465.1 hypothetical protein ACTI_61500 [Actinoplanes sp. OR16]